jgi:hypothetical protein
MLRTFQTGRLFLAGGCLCSHLNGGDMDDSRHHCPHNRSEAGNPYMVLNYGKVTPLFGLRAAGEYCREADPQD